MQIYPSYKLFVFDTKMLKSGENMRRNIKGYIFVLLIALVILFNIFVLNTYRISPWYPTFFWIGLFVLSLILFGKRNRTTSKFVDVIQLVFIYCMGYELLTYLSGLFLGFVRSPYSMTPINIIKNVAPFLIMIIAQEYVRNAVITRFQKEKKVIIAITAGIIAYEISYGIWSYDLKSASDIVKLLSILVGGSITKNCLCSYMAYRTDYKPAILYRSIFELLIYVVPIYPNLGDYIEAMVSMVFPVILLVSIIAIYEKKKYREPKKNLLQTIMLWIPTAFVILLVLGLQSGIFKYRSMSIGSQSMYPNISKGDVVS